jgi:acetylornithine deacetylase/succinyl-diaminopimelate desuccinylase-like protein
MFAHVKGLEALLAVEGELPVNVKAIIEGEEESGSASLQPFLEAQRDRLDGDVVLVSDTAMVAPRTPTICYALRGLAYLQINLTGPNRDLHSGTFGGAVDNPINALCHIVDRLKNRDGLVQIPGFYDDVRPLDEAERNEMAALDFDEEAFLDAVGCVPFGEPGFTTLERIGARPSLDVNGIWGGYTGAGAKTVLPSSAHAKVSMRLVPDQRSPDIADKFARFVESIAPDTVTVEIERMHGGEPSISDRESTYVAAAVRALEQVFGKRPVFIREGGSIPVVSSFKETLGLDAILAGFGLSSDRIHSPNEKFDLENYYAAIQFSSLVWSHFAKG